MRTSASPIDVPEVEVVVAAAPKITQLTELGVSTTLHAVPPMRTSASPIDVPEVEVVVAAAPKITQLTELGVSTTLHAVLPMRTSASPIDVPEVEVVVAAAPKITQLTELGVSTTLHAVLTMPTLMPITSETLASLLPHMTHLYQATIIASATANLLASISRKRREVQHRRWTEDQEALCKEAGRGFQFPVLLKDRRHLIWAVDQGRLRVTEELLWGWNVVAASRLMPSKSQLR